MEGRALTIAHISDIHCGGPDFVPNLLDRAVNEINELGPDIVICSGDLTTFGFKHEYAQAKAYMDRIECESVVVIPGNHDSRNVGYVHFEDMFGDRSSVLRREGVTVVAVDSTEPDLDHGQIGRGRYRWIEEQFSQSDPDELRIFVLHHHLLPVRAPGRSATSSTTRATASSACSVRGSISSFPGTSTFPMHGGSRTCSSSTPAPS